MTREATVKALRDVLYLDEYGGTIETADKGYLNSFEPKAIRILDALTAAGMVVVPRAEMERLNQHDRILTDFVKSKMPNVERVESAMTEAANG